MGRFYDKAYRVATFQFISICICICVLFVLVIGSEIVVTVYY
jgi:hypothetical protein